MGSQSTRICIVGLGFVGLSTAVCFASRGIQTTGLDVDADRIRRLEKGSVPFHEPMVHELLERSRRVGKLKFTTDYRVAIADSEITFLTVGTPSKPDGSANLAFIKAAANSVGLAMRKEGKGQLVVVKSTVPPGTTEGLVGPTLEEAAGSDAFDVVCNPEFLREASAIRDTLAPDRLVIGSARERGGRQLERFYRGVYRKSTPPVIRTSPANAELIKYASNAFLATKITFINEIANLCTSIPGADVSVVAKGLGLDSRIGPSFLNAGLGYGGSCFPKDVSALLRLAEEHGKELGVAKAAAQGNKKQAGIAAHLARSLVGNLRGKRVALLGLAFKPESDDMREAVSLRLIPELISKGAKIVAYDPVAMPNARGILRDNIEYARSVRECLKGADCCILVTEWPEFSRLQPDLLRRLMRNAAIVDGRRVLDRRRFEGAGVKFAAIGLSA